MTPLELGGDIGGSIRIPSHFNGVFGHKPSHGIVSQRNLVDWQDQRGEQDLWVVGPMGITARDVRDALRLLVGATAEKAVAWRVELPAARTTEVTTLRVATCFDRPGYPVDDEVRSLLEGTAKTLAQRGAKVDWDRTPDIDFDENLSVYLQLMYSHMSEDTAESVRRSMTEMLRPLPRGDEILASMGSSLTRWLAVHERRLQLQLQRKWSEFLEDYDVLLAPVAPLPAFDHNRAPMGKRTWTVNGTERSMMFDVLFWAAFSLVTDLPASVAPAGRTRDNLPAGVQIVGPYLEDETPLAVAGMLERHHAAFEPPPGYA